MNSLLVVLVFVLVSLIFYYNWSRRKLYLLASKLNGPLAFPIIGNASLFIGDTSDLFKVLKKLSDKYGKSFRIWFGSQLLVCLSHPKQIEKILSSSKMAYKHDVYKVMGYYLGEGLLTNHGGEKYKKHRRIIQPLLNLKFVTENLNSFQKYVNKLLQDMELHQDKGTFDVFQIIHHCYADIIADSILGINMNSQNGENEEFINATFTMYTNFYERMSKPWLIPNIVYNFTRGKKLQDQVIKTTKSFINEAIRQSRERIKSNKDNFVLETTPIIDRIVQIRQDNLDAMNEDDFINHMLTLYLASEDLMTLTTTMFCICFGMYPEYQKKAVEEIRTVIGEHTIQLKYEDLQKLTYLDMCMRDVLRLIPAGPLILRQASEDFQLDDLLIPQGCGTAISLFDVHLNPEIWENPTHFHPDHFLPDVHEKRHPYAYIPFSAGGRSCVGKVLATLGLKLVMVNILQKFEIEADGKFPDFVLIADITVRAANGYKVRLKKRIWN